MRTRDGSWSFGLLLLMGVSGALGCGGCVGQDEQQSLSDLPKDVVREWRKVGA